MALPDTDAQHRLAAVHRHYQATPWISPPADEPLLRAWQRCRSAGLDEAEHIAFEPITRSQLTALADEYAELLRVARPETRRLADTLRGSSGALLLCSQRGAVIDRLCDESRAPAHLRVASRLGVNLAEACVGSTAPSIALTEGRPYLVGPEAHFCRDLTQFFCVAAPIDSPDGRRLAALDLTFHDQVPDFDVYGLVVDAALAIENALFSAPPEGLLMHFHPRAELVGTPMEALVAVDGAGLIRGANRAAARWLCRDRGSLIGQPVAEVFEVDLYRSLGSVGQGGAQGLDQRPRLAQMITPGGLPVAVAFDHGGSREPSGCLLGDAPLPLPALQPPRPGGLTKRLATSADSPTTLREIESQAIRAALAAQCGNVSAVTRALGVSRNTIYRRCPELGRSTDDGCGAGETDGTTT